MSIGAEEVKKIAQLARLELDEAKAQKLGEDIASILNFVDQLQTADTQDIAPMAHPMDAVQILRADEVTESNQREKFQAVAPATENGLYLVPKVIE